MLDPLTGCEPAALGPNCSNARFQIMEARGIVATSHQTSFQACLEQLLGQVDPDEHHLADARLALAPDRADIAAHHLVHALEHDLLFHGLDIEHAFVAQHVGAVDLDHRAQEVFQLGGVEGARGLEHEGLHVVVVGVVVRVIAVLTVFMPMVMTAIRTVLVAVVMAVSMRVVLEEVRVDVELGVQVEAAQVQHVLDGNFAKVDPVLGRTGVHVLDAVGQGIGLFGRDQVGLAQENLVGKPDLTASFLTAVELGLAMFGVHQGQDRVQQVLVGDVIVHEKGLSHGAGVGQAGGLDHDALELELAIATFGRQVAQGGAQVLADRAADATVVHLDDLLVGVGHEDVVVDVFFTELVFDDGDFLSVTLGQDAFEQGGFAAAEKTGKDGDGDQTHNTSVALTVRPCDHRVALFLLCLNYDTDSVSEPSQSRPQRADKKHSAQVSRDRRSLFERVVEFINPGPDSTDELIESLAEAEHRELIEPQSRVMLEGVIRMADMTAGDVMVAAPRIDFLDIEQPYEALLAEVINTGHSRFPVFDGSRDNIIGVLMAKDLLKLQRAPGLSLRTLLRSPMFVPESKGLNELLRDFRTSRNHLAIVIDEFGKTAGLITIEDVLEEIVGEIEDEFDDEASDSSIFTLADGSQRVAGDTLIEDVNEAFGTQFPIDEFDTIGGLVAHELGKVPRRGEVFELGGLRLSVMLARGGSVRWFKVTRLPVSESLPEA